MIDVSRLLPKLVRANPELAAKLAWTRAAGEGLRHNAVAVRLEEKTLVVAVADALWKKQLESMASELLFRIKNVLGAGTVNQIAFRISPGDIVRPRSSERAEQNIEPRESVLPTELLFAAGSIADEELRARFLRAANNLIARRDSQLND
jgi:hypothetical protein